MKGPAKFKVTILYMHSGETRGNLSERYNLPCLFSTITYRSQPGEDMNRTNTRKKLQLFETTKNQCKNGAP
jgi:hypothetical protein